MKDVPGLFEAQAEHSGDCALVKQLVHDAGCATIACICQVDKQSSRS